jgi:hypothetical protein
MDYGMYIIIYKFYLQEIAQSKVAKYVTKKIHKTPKISKKLFKKIHKVK